MDELSNLLAQPLARLGATTVTLGHGLTAGAALVLLLLAMLGIGLWRSSRARAAAAAQAAVHARESEDRISGIMQAQAEMQGRMAAIAEVFGNRQAELTRSLGERLDAMTGRIGQTMSEQTRSTHDSLTKLQERLEGFQKTRGVESLVMAFKDAALVGGNVGRGRELFVEHPAAACTRVDSVPLAQTRPASASARRPICVGNEWRNTHPIGWRSSAPP